MVAPALVTPSLSLVFAAGVLVLAAPWLIRLPRLAIGLLGVSLAAGQLLRLPLPGQGGGILLSDLAVVAVIASAFVHLSKTPGARRAVVFFLLVSPWLLWSGWTTAIHLPQLAFAEQVVTGAYWLRLTAYLLLIPALIAVLSQPDLARYARRISGLTFGFLISAGFLQLAALPYLNVLHSFGLSGWDPHQWRLVSTWLDPNFLGSALILVGPVSIAYFLFQGSRLPPIARIAAVGALLTALAFTQSRSSFVALALAAFICSPLLIVHGIRQSFHHRMALIALAGLTTVCVGLLICLLGSRAFSGINDPTIQLRLSSLSQGWRIVEQHGLLGVGYNAYQFAAQRAGFISDFTVHSRAGSDSSFLNLWATSGIPGVVLFLVPWIAIAVVLRRKLNSVSDPLIVAALIGLAAWLIHGHMVNSVLYPHLLIVAAGAIALMLVQEKPPSTLHAIR